MNVVRRQQQPARRSDEPAGKTCFGCYTQGAVNNVLLLIVPAIPVGGLAIWPGFVGVGKHLR